MDPKQFYFSFRGRVNRSAYWLKWVLPTYGISVLMGLMCMLVVSLGGDTTALVGFFILITLGPFFYIHLAVGAKRYHYRDKSAWWLLIAFIPIIGSIWQFVELGFLKGTDGPNRFGPDPLGTNEPT